MKKTILLLFTALFIIACDEPTDEKKATKKKVTVTVDTQDTVQPTTDDIEDDAGGVVC